ncbi:MAG: biotin--[acetyl-CoA-carboxylase] ligase [Acidimicrobiales bacterium]
MTGSGPCVPVPFAVPERLQVVDSTNRYLVELVRTGLRDGSQVPEGYAVVAERQSEGRGRLGRRWEAPAGSAVLCSILLRPELGPNEIHLAAWAVALAAVDACAELAGVELSLKWPNDLLARPSAVGDEAAASQLRATEERKVAGVLSEVVPQAGGHGPPGGPEQGPAGVVVGIGINVNWPPRWPPQGSEDPELASIAAQGTALNRVAGREIDRNGLVSRLLAHTASRNGLLSSGKGRHALASQYRAACRTIGRVVRVELAGETIVGTAVDLDEAGRLLVSTGAFVRTIAAGDVVHLR